MLKAKSISREFKEYNEYYSRVHLLKRSQPKYPQLHRASQARNLSNQYMTPNYYNDQGNAKHCSTSKPIRKYARPEPQEQKVAKMDGKKNPKAFIGHKLKKKLQHYFTFLALINYSLKIIYKRNESHLYKVYIGKGNNSKLIKKVFYNRFWWSITQNQEEANFIWTQKIKKSIIDRIENASPTKTKQQHCQQRKRTSKKRQSKRLDFQQEFEDIICQKDKKILKTHCKKQTFGQDLKSLIKQSNFQRRSTPFVIHNHIQHHRTLTNKKNLYHSLLKYCNESIFEIVPLTFHITNNAEEEYLEMMKIQENDRKIMWIIKPGENSNRGTGIEVCKKVEQMKKIITREQSKHPERTFIIQKYVNPFLFHRRKFDIRCFVLVTATPKIATYFYPRGYIRTSSFEFSTKNCSNKFIHLTNDAIQKKTTQYSKFEHGNKVRFQEFQRYLDLFQEKHGYNFNDAIIPQIKSMILISIKSAANLNPNNKKSSFELLGYDFMIDDSFRPWLIEINTNPCLETGCDVLNEIIPPMLENLIKITVDTVFKPPKIQDWPLNELITCPEQLLESNQFQLLYQETQS